MPKPPTTLTFNVIGTYPYPYATDGAGTALTVCRFNNDPVLAFLTQTTYSDDIVYLSLHLSVSNEIGRITCPLGQDAITGMAYDIPAGLIWAVQATVRTDTIIGFDPNTGALVQTVNVPSELFCQGLAYNGLFFVRACAATLEAITKAGTIFATLNAPAGSSIKDITHSFFSYIASDTNGNRLVILGPFGTVIGVCTAPPGAPGGITGVAFDNLLDMTQVSQLPTADGSWGAVGTPYHPDTPWAPTPFLIRHNVYLANEIDQTIYFGYLV